MSKFLSNIKRWGYDLLNVVLPNVCTVCHTPLVDGEDVMCLRCSIDLPRTDLYKFQPNPIHERLVTLTTPIERASSLFWYYKNNEYASLIHDAKYHGRPSVAVKLARMHAIELKKIGFFNDIDIILPVPMHFIKQIMRGYNQAEEIAKGISDVTGLEVGNNLKATRRHTSQTRKGAAQRMINTKGIYIVREAQDLDNKHILLVDDVITTGATLVACIDAVHEVAPTARFSVFSLALTHLI